MKRVAPPRRLLLTRRRFLGALAAGAGTVALGAGLGRHGGAAADARRFHLRLKALRRADLHEPHDWAG